MLCVGVPGSDPLSAAYTAVFYTIGYEKRSRFIAAAVSGAAEKVYALKYPAPHHLAFGENESWAKTTKAQIVPLRDYQEDTSLSFKRFILDALKQANVDARRPVFLVDVSSMDRSLAARLLYGLLTYARPPFTLRLAYAPAAYAEPSFAFAPMRWSAPAIPELAGPLETPHSNLSLLLGVGYEYGVALGLLQNLEPDSALAFIPEGRDPRYMAALRKANFDFDFGQESVRTVTYSIYHPLALLDRLMTITADASRQQRVVIVPSGPKIFAALATVVAILRAPLVTLLRVSLASDPPHDIEPDGSVVAVDLLSD